MEKISHEDFLALSRDEQRRIADEAFRNWEFKKELGRVFFTIVNARQYLDEPALSHIFSAPMSYLTILFRQKMLAGEFSEGELRVAVQGVLAQIDASRELKEFMDAAVTDFMKLGS